MRKMLSLMVMMLCAITSWAQAPLENPTYFQIPSSPYVFETTPENVKGAYFQNWICTDAAAWQTVAAGTTVWYGRWENLNETPTFKANPTFANEPAEYGFDGMQVRNQNKQGRQLWMYVKNVSSITGYFVANNMKREFYIDVYEGEPAEGATPAVSAKSNMDGSSYATTVEVKDLDVTKEYKVVLTSNNSNCWVQAIKFEGTSSGKYDTHFYLEQVGNTVSVKNVAEGEVIRYESKTNESLNNLPVGKTAEIFPAKGIQFTPGDVLNIKARAFASDAEDAASSNTFKASFELPVPTITADYVCSYVKVQPTVNEETGETTVSSVAMNGEWWKTVYEGSENVLWTTTKPGDYFYSYLVADEYKTRTKLDGTEVEIPVAGFNRMNTMYFNVTEPSIVKVTSAPYYKNGNLTTNGTHITIDGIYYECDAEGIFKANVTPGVHTFVACKWGSEPGIQMIEIQKGFDPTLDVVEKDLAQYIKTNAAALFTEETATLNLNAYVEYTMSEPIELPAGTAVMINGNGAKLKPAAGANFVAQNGLVLDNLTINAAELGNAALIQMGAEPVKTVLGENEDGTPKEAPGQIVDFMAIKNCTINDLPSYLYWDGGKTWIINDFSIESSVIKLNTADAALAGNAIINAYGYGMVSCTIAESTIYNVGENASAAKYLLRYNNAARADRMGVEASYVIFRNNTMANVLQEGGHICNYDGMKSHKTANFTLLNNIFYGMKDVARRFVGGNYSTNPTHTQGNNTYMLADGTFDNQANYDKSGTIIEMNPGFVDATIGNFKLAAATMQAERQTGDPRWATEYAPVYTSNGVVADMNAIVPKAQIAFYHTPVEVVLPYQGVNTVILKAWEGTKGSDLAINYNDEMQVTSLKQITEAEIEESETRTLEEDGETQTWVSIYPQSNVYPMAAIMLENSNAVASVEEEAGMIRLYGMFYPASNLGGEEDNQGVGEPVEMVYSVYWPKQIIDELNIAAGEDIAEAIEENKVFFDETTMVNLEEGTYTLNAPVVLPENAGVMVNGNGANIKLAAGANFVATNSIVLNGVTIDASELGNAALIQMGANPVKAEGQNGQFVEMVAIQNSTINDLPSYIYSDGGKAWIINDFSIENSVIKLNTTDEALKGQALIRANGYGIVSNMITESTIYNVGEADAAAKYLIQYNNSARADRMNAEMAYVILRNNTMVNAWSAGGQIANYSGIAGKNTTTFTMTDNIFVGMTDIARRFVGGNNGSAVVTFANNTYQKADGTYDNASNYDKSGTAIEESPRFADAEAGDFTVHARAEQANRLTGDPRWLTNEYIPCEFTGAKWVFNKWSKETLDALKADAALETGLWSVYEKNLKDGEQPETENDNRAYYLTSTEDGPFVTVNAEGEKVAIKELEGLTYTAKASRNIGIAFDIESTKSPVGTNAYPSFLWMMSNKKAHFAINDLAAGTTVTMWVESHKDGDKRGVALQYADGTAIPVVEGDEKVDDLTKCTWLVEQGGTVNVVPNSGCHIYAIDLDKEVTTGINNTVVENAANGTIFNLAGQKVDNSYKGIVIKNGKKVMVK